MTDSLFTRLSNLYDEVADNLDEAKPILTDADALPKVVAIAHNLSNRALARFLMSCLAAKMDNPSVDVRKPYTEIVGGDSFSGRTYDQNQIQALINKYNLPLNPTTAYLTPTFRNHNVTMTPALDLVGRPRHLYKYVLELLDLVYRGGISPENLLKEIYRQLIIFKTTNDRRIGELRASIKTTKDAQPLSSEQIATLIGLHLSSGKASRLPTLIVAAAYAAVSNKIGEVAKPLNAHNAADRQTGALGDVEITLISDDDIVTCYEMKDKKVTQDDILIAMQKISQSTTSLDNYVFITTKEINPDVQEYAHGLYADLGVEFTILDCLGFIRHFLHFFHRSRMKFLDTYQELVLAEPNSSVGQPLKEAFLALRAAAEVR